MVLVEVVVLERLDGRVSVSMKIDEAFGAGIFFGAWCFGA